MKRERSWTKYTTIVAIALCLLSTAGCDVTSEDVGGFVMDFARQWLAAWVL